MADSNQSASENQTQPATGSTASAAPSASAPATPEAKTVTSDAPPAGSTPAAASTPPAETPPAATPPETKPGETPPETKPPEAAKPPEAPAQAVPDTYTAKLPDGLELDSGLVTALTPALKGLKLTQDQFQSLTDAFVTYQKGGPQRMLAADLARTQADPELGGANYARTVSYVNEALRTTTLAERQWMERAGIGNRLEFVAMFARFGRMMMPDGVSRGAPTSAESVSTASKLYGGKDMVNQSK